MLFRLALQVGVHPEVSAPGEVEVRRLTAPDQQFVFVFNHAEKPADANIAIDLPFAAAEARDLETDQPVEFRAEGQRIVLHKAMPTNGVWVVKVMGRK